ncbi:acyl carrier protein phosphodiesterase [Rhodoflexus caldus]|uniref:acyl carrier protein phosphodiesterase n=1 Tax=Rhodoflexus caldus TaxID=2891236 RepID=UPI00202A4C26|nr:ACP phosphodiesterase [Rhodoflexus caldus]
MNFLAHLALAAPDEGLLVGNFIADHVKGNRWQEFAPSVQAGILLHRAIDHFADTHPLVRQSAQRLRPRYRHYAGVLVDVFYDHFLAASWNRYMDVPLPVFSKEMYALMNRHYELLPPTSRLFLQYAAERDILAAYAEVEVIGRVLQGMARRIARPSGIETATEELQTHYREFGEEFAQFWDEIVRFVAQKKQVIS